MVAEPVADEISVTSVDQNWNLLEDAGDKTVEWLHPVSLEKEVAVDIKVAAVIAADFDTKLTLDICLVQELANPAECGVAKVARILTFSTNIVNVLQLFCQ